MLKVSSPQPPTIEQPPMDLGSENPPMQNMGGGIEQLSNDSNQPPMDTSIDNVPMDNKFDTDFDAGVDADEETDPKKYIQQLTGKLSQTLRSYNDNLPQPDVDLNKFVAGMINKQATNGLNQNDVDDILKKIKSNEADDTTQQDLTDVNGNEADNFDDNEIPNESLNRKQMIDELFQNIMSDDNTEKYQEVDKRKSFRKKPFTSPDFH